MNHFLAWYSTWFIPKPVINHVFMIVNKRMTCMLKHFLYYRLYCLYREKLPTEILELCKCKPVCSSVGISLCDFTKIDHKCVRNSYACMCIKHSLWMVWIIGLNVFNFLCYYFIVIEQELITFGLITSTYS